MIILPFFAKLLATRPVSALAGATAGTGSFLMLQAKNLARARRNRHQVRLMSEMTPRELKDIGLLPSDITGALSVHWSDDPSKVLVTRRPVPASLQGNAPLRSHPRRHASVTQPVDAGECDDLCLARSV